jgi:RNA polymerase sigma-70 factor (TIGR02957 family)
MAEVTTAHDRLRPLMFSIAYRMLGSVGDAEDVVQEAFLRMHRDPTTPRSPDAYAATVTTRLAIDHLRLARTRRERYVGTWLPEPLPTRDDADEGNPAAAAERAESLSMAFLVLLERLTPVERAVLLLREVFEYDYGTVAEVVGRSATNCRQILARAHAHIGAERPRFDAAPQQRDALARRFLAACHEGDLAGLERLLADDVTFYADGDGKPPAVNEPVTGRTQVARFLLGLFRQAARTGLRVVPMRVNGNPGGRVVDEAGRLRSVFALHVIGGRVQAIHNVVNPDKLGHLEVGRIDRRVLEW